MLTLTTESDLTGAIFALHHREARRSLLRGGGHGKDIKKIGWGSFGALKISNPCAMPHTPCLLSALTPPAALLSLTESPPVGLSLQALAFLKALTLPSLLPAGRNREAVLACVFFASKRGDMMRL